MRIAFNVKKKRPGCVLIQAALGCDVPREQFNTLFPPDTWIVDSMEDMLAYPVTDEQLEKLSVMAAASVDVACPNRRRRR